MDGTIFFCVSCNASLTNDQRMYSEGTCPFCGYRGPTADTIVESYPRAYEKVRIAPWWKFWVKRFTYRWRDESYNSIKVPIED